MRLRGTPAEREARLSDLVRELGRACEASFEASRGAAVRLQQGEGCWRADVTRGELEGALVLTATRDEAGVLQQVHLRAMARARSVQAEILAGPARARRAQAAGLVLGALVFAGLCALTIGVHAPAYLLGGLFMVVVGLALGLAGSSLAGWVARSRQAERLDALRARLRRDPALLADLDRLRQATRRLARHRERLAGTRERAPFRAEATESTGAPARPATPTGPAAA